MDKPQQSYRSSSRKAAVSPRTVESSGVGGGGGAAAAGGGSAGGGGSGGGPGSHVVGAGSTAAASSRFPPHPNQQQQSQQQQPSQQQSVISQAHLLQPAPGHLAHLPAHFFHYPYLQPASSSHLQQVAAATAAAAATSSSPGPLAMNSGPAGGSGQPPAGLQPPPPSSSSSSSRDQHTQPGTDPNLNITIMNITVPPVVPVASGLRFVHPYLPPPPPHPHPPPQSAASMAQVASSNSASPVSASSGPSSVVQQQQRQHPPSAPSPASAMSSPAAAYTRDVYRNASPNVNERVAISVSSSPVSSQVVGVGSDYVISSRCDRPRISLLPAPASIAPAASPTAPTDYHSAAARNNRSAGPGILAMQQQEYRPSPVDMAQLQQDAPPFKKIRLGQPTQQLPPTQQQQQQQQQQSTSQTDCQRLTSAQDTMIKQKHIQQMQPLRIDTRPSAGVYTPQTEAISPTLPEPNTQEDAAFRSTKDDLLQQIAKVDREIAKRETMITNLRKKLKELEEVASQPFDAGKRPVEEASSQPKHQSLAQKIYAENRKKAEEAHRLLEKLGPKVKLPLYNQPSDTSVYQENRTRHQCMKARLEARLRKEHAERASLHLQQSQTYAILVQEWHRKVEKIEATQKRKTKEAKNREFFEKVFPELRKQREDKERFNRVGARIKSEADLEEIMDGLQEQEEELSTELKNALKARQMEDKKMRSYAVIPPLLLDVKQRKLAFQNRNGLLQPEELEAMHSERKLINVWSTSEHDMFKEKYLQHPKNFGAIAQSFEHKSVADCVHHYYLTKKAENYKQLLRKSRRTRTRNNPNNKVNNSNSTIGPIDILTTGVTTRLQREQQQKTQENPQSSSVASSSSSNAMTTTSTSSTITSSSSSSTSVTSASTVATASSSVVAAVSSSSSNSAAVASSLSSEPSVTMATTTITSSTSAAAASASVPSTSATTTTSSVLTTTSSSSASAKDAREANKENKEIKTEPKDSILIKDIKEESHSSSETLSSRESKIESKGALSSSSNSSVANANNPSGNLEQQQKDKKKNAGITGGSAVTSRSKDKKKENHAAPMETSDEEAQSMDAMECSGRQLGPHPCVICQTTVEAGNQSRPLSRSQASQYGLREDQVPVGARVCNTCRCKSVRGRYTTCPLPGCPNLSNANSKTRVKRLRALPSKWNDLPPEIRDPIIQEFQIPSNTTKCCSACFNRISRRLAPHFSGAGGDGATDEADAIARQWTDEELELLRKALREHGTNWPKVSEQIAGKSNHQCKNYYLTYRKKLGLDQVVAEYYQSLGEERRPCLTDEEESGSSTSSCDELAVHDTSDTASAGSPANTIVSNTPTASAASSSSTTGGAAGVPMPAFSQSQDVKVGEKLVDVAVVSLVAPSPMISQPPQTNPPTSTREDYDSSATETADEGQGGTDLESSTSVVMSLATAVNATNAQTVAAGGGSSHPAPQTIVQTQPQPPALVQSPPSTTSTNNNPLTVKDLMLGVIEMQLKRNQNSPGGSSSSVPVSSGTPTISSILKTDHRNDITFVRELRPATQAPSMSNTAIPNRDPNLATLSVVTGPHHGHRSASSPQQISQMQATITPCPPSAPSQQQPQPSSQDMLPKEGLVVMQVQQAMRETEGTLDLSIKKPRPQEYNHTLQPPIPHKPPAAVGHYRPEPPPPATYYHTHGHPESQGRSAKSPHMYTSSPRPQAPITPKLNKVSVPPTSHPKLSPKLTNMSATHKTGSITHGTPVSSARYEGMLRQMTPPGSASQPNPSTTPDAMMIVVGSKESGSITQGTPVHPFAVDKRSQMYDYHRSIRHSPVTTSNVPVQASQNSGVVVSHGQSSSSQYNSYQSRQAPSYTMEQLSSRQIIMNDYITSQQMHPRNRSSSSAEAPTKNEVPTTLYCASTPPPQSHSQPRQGVIQRHNTQKHYAPPPPGLEAFSSLVDVAVQQPSLPVPHPPPASSSGHEGLCMSIERMYTDRYAMDNRSLQNMPRLARQQAAQYQMAVAMQQREEQRERERDLLLREKQQEEEQQQRIQREKEQQQQQQQLHHQQQMERIHQREKEIQQQQEHRLAQQQREQEMHQAAAAQAAADHRIAVQQREKEIQQQQQSHAEHRLSMHQQQQQQQREKDMQQQHYRLVQQQREKEMQMAAAAAQREKEHQEHRLAVQQREKEMQQQQQQELRLAVQKREKELQQQQDHRLAVQRENLVYLQQQQQRYQKQQQMHIQQHQQQRMEAERRQIVQIYKDQQEAQLYRELAERQCESPSTAKGSGFYQPSRIQQQPQPPTPSSRHNQSSSNQQSDSSSTLTAASLIDAIITHQINQSADNSSGTPASNNQPSRPGDRLFQGFHRDSPAEPNGMAHSPAGEENVANRESSSASGSGSGTKGITLGEHVDHIVSKDYGPPMSSYRPYQGYMSEDQWKRRKGTEPDSVKSGDERQIIRVAQQKPASSQSQSSHQSQPVSKQQQQPPTQFHTEPVSPPEPTTNHYPRRYYEPSTATTTTPVTPSNKSHLSPLDYVKNKIVEVMRTEDDKTSSGDRNGGGNEKDDKCADSSPSGEMVIDESPSQQQPAPPQPQPPTPTPTTFYPFNALGVHTGPPPAPPPLSGGTTVTVVKSEEPTPILSAQYEPLSDED